MKHLLRILPLIGALLFALSPANAQVTTASINGVVSDKDGTTLPGANVVVVHEPTGAQYGVTSRLDGKFNLPNLRVGGPYKITISYVGYEDQYINDIYLKLGEARNLDVSMKGDAAELDEVVVFFDQNSSINAERTGAITAINNEQLMKMPTISRSAEDIYRLNPAASGNSFAGRNDQYNNFSLDGAVFNNPFGLDAATPGGQSNAQPISLDAIDQIQVSVAPYDVTQAGFTGAGVNAVTKSGTNNFEGTVFGFYRNQDMTGDKVDGDDIIVPDLTQFQTGLSIGGPIIKNKLFFFANFEIARREDLGSNFIANNEDGTLEGNESRVLASDLDAVSAALADVGYETGPYQGYTHDSNSEKGLLKLDWNINANHDLTVTYNFLNAFREQNAHPSALGLRGPNLNTLQFFNSGYRINNDIQSVKLEVKSIFGSDFSNKFQVAYTHFDDSRDPFSGPAPVINIARDGTPYIIAGHEPFSINNRLDQKVFQVTNNFDIYKGAHTITVGGSFERFAFDNSFNLGVYEPFEAGEPFGGNTDFYSGGTFASPGFSSVEEFLAFANSGQLSTIFGYSADVFANNNANDSWALAETNVGQFALYAQDKWQVNQKLTLTIGLRMDLPLYFDTDEKIQENIDRKGGLLDPANGIFDGNYAPSVVYFDENGNEVQFDHTVLPEQKPLWSPRLGYNYKASETLQFRGGTGLFTGRLPFVWIGNQVANPDFFFYTMTEEDFQFPQVWRSNFGFDKTLKGGWTISSDLIYTKDINAMLVRNFGLRTPSGTLNGVDNRPVYLDSDRAQGPFGGATNAYVFTNTDEGRSINWSVELKRSWQNGLYASLAYNYLNAKDVSSIEAEISGDAYDRNPVVGNSNNPALTPSLYGNQHRIIGTANKRFEYGGDKFATTFSLFFEYAQGGRFSYTYSGDINNDGSGLNDLLYIPTASELQAMNFENETQRQAFESYIQQDDYLSENRGDYVEQYDILSPWYSRWDLRILQDYKVSNDNVLQLSFDFLNIGNLISSSWGVRELPQNIQPVGVRLDDTGNPVYSFDPSLTETFANDFSLDSRWQFQFGVRYSFK